MQQSRLFLISSGQTRQRQNVQDRFWKPGARWRTSGFQGYDEQSSKGTKVLASAGEMAVREGNDFYLGSGVGKTCQRMVQQDCCPYASRTRSTTTTWSSNCQQCLRSKVCEWTEVVKRKRTEKTKLWRNGKGMVINLLVQRSCLPESGLLLAWIDRRR